MRYAILVEGIEPAPQGSKVLGKYGNLRESCKRVKPWREAVRKEALASCSSMLQGPVRVAVEFRFRRPLADYTSGGELKQAPRYYIKRKNDLDKCCARSVMLYQVWLTWMTARWWTFTPSADIADRLSGLGLL